jgi:hypothetical protein
MDIIDGYDGDIVQLSGDDLLVAFPSPNPSTSAVYSYDHLMTLQRAMLCACEILLNCVHQPGTSPTLEGVKVVVGYGHYINVLMACGGYLNYFVYSTWLENFEKMAKELGEGVFSLS